MPTIEIPVSSPQQSVCPVVMKILDARPEVHCVPAADIACDCCGTDIPADGPVRYEHHSNDLTSCFVCSACEAAYQAWKAGAYCRDCGVLLTDDEKAHDADDVPLCAAWCGQVDALRRLREACTKGRDGNNVRRRHDLRGLQYC